MIDPKRIRSVIFDFAYTLCSELYFKPLGQDALDLIDRLIFGDSSTRWADPWMTGELTSRDIAAYLSEHLHESEDEILSALRLGCSNLTFNPAVYSFALQQRRNGRKTALVTGNVDVFTEVVVPCHGLNGVFDVVLNTADHGTRDKGVLWRRAFRAFGPEYDFQSSLLIEDGSKWVSLFESLGGWAYRYEEDRAFQDWLEQTGFEINAEGSGGFPK